mmetsp:Transcript_18223/g.24011  ORF Transcript_18223/g.24011 Transcript_18223/m.24011 type:complete len:232 (-) Transcript_18223:168-863(-)
MKTAILFFSLFAAASAFNKPWVLSPKKTSLYLSSWDLEPKKSEALPFAYRPTGLDTVQLAGDKGFDPLNLGSSKEKLLFYREAEIKHARLAMLATLGWIAGELYGTTIATILDLPALVVNPNEAGIGLEPSILNTGLAAIPIVFWILVVGWTAAIEVQLNKLNEQYNAQGYERQPGDFGFDPLGFFPARKDAQLVMLEKEIKHGRIAMLAITIFVIQEFASKVPIAAQFPF